MMMNQDKEAGYGTLDSDDRRRINCNKRLQKRTNNIGGGAYW